MATIIGPESFKRAFFGSPINRETPLVISFWASSPLASIPSFIRSLGPFEFTALEREMLLMVSFQATFISLSSLRTVSRS